jgi:importin subunit alpha-6/7
VKLCSRTDFPKIQYEAAWCLTNLASGESNYVKVLVDHGVIEAMVNLLSCQSLEIIEQAIWCLGNMAGDNTKVRDKILMTKAIDPIANIILSMENLP